MAAEMASSEAWETLITMPRRFISRITARPRSFRPCHFGVGAAGVGIVAGPVVRGKLDGAHAEAVHLADHGGVAIQIEAAFDIEHGGDFAAAVNALDVRRRCARFRWSGGCGRSARCAAVQHAQRLLGFEAAGVVVLGHEDGKEERAEAAFFGARQVELAVGLALRRCRRRGRTRDPRRECGRRRPASWSAARGRVRKRRVRPASEQRARPRLARITRPQAAGI